MHVPIYRHPSLTVLVDDSDSFLRSLSFQLDPALASKAFHDTRHALDWLQQYGAPAPAGPLQANFDAHPDSPERCNIAIDIDHIHRISGQRQRFMTPSVLVVDYSMPQMNGVDFCRAVQHLPCKKILFTGAADEKIAVDAFNRGLIDRYIKKSDDAALDKLEAEIVSLQKEYFEARSDSLRDLLALHDYNFVYDPAMAALVRHLSAAHGFVEHYLFASPAGILFYDREGHPALMVVETADSLRAHFEVARDNDAPPSLLAALQEHCVVPFFSDGDGMYSGAMEQSWHQYCLPTRLCEGRQTYYWALFDLPPAYATQAVFPFAQFLREQRGALA